MSQKLGFRHSNEAKKLISTNNAKYWLGKSRSLETINKIKEAKIGKSNNRKGIKHTEVTKKLISNRLMGRKAVNKKYPDFWICSECKKSFPNITGHKRLYCSTKCRDITRSRFYRENNDKHPNYIDGRTPLHITIRNLNEEKQWIRLVFKRDNYTCQECGTEVSGNLQAHHIKPFSIILSEFLLKYNQFSPIEDKETLVRLALKYEPFWNITNGRTLCFSCHKNTESFVGKVINYGKEI